MEDELLIKYLLQETSIQENLEVEQWLKDSANQLHFQQFEKIWKESKVLSVQREINEDDAWERFKLKREGSARRTKKLFLPAWLKIAAVLIAVVGLWYAYTNSQSGYKQIIAGQQVMIKTLPDGSELTLNKNSEISYEGNFKNNRNIRLSNGEVFFKVTPDTVHPFIIDADNVRIQVVGTAFNVKHEAGGTEVIVESGVVRVSYGGGFIELHKGEKVNIQADHSVLKKEAVSDQLYNYYRTNTFVANKTTLKQLIAVLNSAYQADIKINDPEIQALTITTTFKAQELENILQIIAEIHHLKITHKGTETLLTK